MTPTEYIEKQPTYTAVQWDTSTESADWIVATMQGAQKAGDDLMVRDAMDRDTPLAPGSWVVLDEASGVVSSMGAEEFEARFETRA